MDLIEGCMQGKVDKELCNVIMLREGIRAELDAINMYETFAKATTDKLVREVMLDIAKEEKTHAGEFQFVLTLRDPEHEAELKKGAEEVKEKHPFTMRR